MFKRMFEKFLEKKFPLFNEGELINNESLVPTNEKVEKFNNILKFAKLVLEDVEWKTKHHRLNYNTHPLVDLIRALEKKVQADYLTQMLYQENDGNSEGINPRMLLFDEINTPVSNDGRKFYDIVVRREIEKEVHLSRDVVLPRPWKRTRLIHALTNIGKGRLEGEWRQDDSNHNIELWLPIGISWVKGGNHSIASGIIQGSGIIVPRYIYDITNVYDCIYCDGQNFIKKEDKSVICPVQSIEFAAIFEIGRIMKDNVISF